MAPTDAATAEQEHLQCEATAKAEADRATTLDVYEAKHAAVRTQALAIVNIMVLIPVTLDRAANNYNR
jgi:hypothetical protein